MRWTEALQGVRMPMFLNILNRWKSAELNQEEAAELLGVTERTFRRWTRRYGEEGEAGLIDRRLGKASGRRVPSDRAEEVEQLNRERYQGFTVKRFHEHLVKDHGFGLSYMWTKLHLQWAGVVPKAPRKGTHRRKYEWRRDRPRLSDQSRPGAGAIGRRHIGAFSPRARGRSERAFQTLQDRLPKELRLVGITTAEVANAFIRDVYLPAQRPLRRRSGRRGLGLHAHSGRQSR
jgi:transposase